MTDIFINPIEFVKCEFIINKRKNIFYDKMLSSDIDNIKTYLEYHIIFLPFLKGPISNKNFKIELIKPTDEILELLNNDLYSPLFKLTDILEQINDNKKDNSNSDSDSDDYKIALNNIIIETECLNSINVKNNITNNLNLTEYLSDNDEDDDNKDVIKNQTTRKSSCEVNIVNLNILDSITKF